MDEKKESKYKMFPNKDGALTKEAAREVRAAVAKVENEINEIIEESQQKQR